MRCQVKSIELKNKISGVVTIFSTSNGSKHANWEIEVKKSLRTVTDCTYWCGASHVCPGGYKRFSKSIHNLMICSDGEYFDQTLPSMTLKGMVANVDMFRHG